MWWSDDIFYCGKEQEISILIVGLVVEAHPLVVADGPRQLVLEDLRLELGRSLQLEVAHCRYYHHAVAQILDVFAGLEVELGPVLDHLLNLTDLERLLILLV